MDLDNLKKTWQQTDIKPNLEDKNILQMLNNRTKGSYAQLLKAEQTFLILAIVIGLGGGALFCFIDYRMGLLYFFMLGLSAIWQSYKIRFLKKMDTLKMGIVEISQHINRYRKFIYWEILGGVPLALVFVTLFSLFYLKPKDFTLESLMPTIAFASTVLIITTIIVIPIYKIVYLKNIKNIEKSVAEVNEYRNED